MLPCRYLAGASSLALLAVLGLAAPANAQDDAVSVDEVIVTGSFIAGTPEDAALPVNVIGQVEMQKQGSPTTVDLLKTIPGLERAAMLRCRAAPNRSSRQRMARKPLSARTFSSLSAGPLGCRLSRIWRYCVPKPINPGKRKVSWTKPAARLNACWAN